MKGNTTGRLARKSQQRVALAAGFLVCIVGTLQYLAPGSPDGDWHIQAFRKPSADLEELRLEEPPSLQRSRGHGIGDARACEPFYHLENDSRVLFLAQEWERLVGPRVELILRGEELQRSTQTVSLPSVVEASVGGLLRMLWGRHGTPVFAFWLRHFHVQFERSVWEAWDLEENQPRELLFEEHGLGMWIAQQIVDGNIAPKMDGFTDPQETDSGIGLLRDVSLLCAHSVHYMREQNASLYAKSKWTREEDTFKLAIGSTAMAKYDDVIHATVWGRLQFMKDKSVFEEVLLYLGRLCSLAPLNGAYMACGHGIGHGIKHFSGNEGIPTEASTFKALEVNSIDSALKEVAARFAKGEAVLGEELSLTTDGGVKKKVEKRGDEWRGNPREKDMVALHFTSRFGNGTVYETSKDGDGNTPLTFRIGVDPQVKGLEIGVRTMKLGEVSTLTLSPEYASRGTESPDALPPLRENLQYEVELLWWEGSESLDTAREKNSLSFDLLMLACESLASSMSVSGDGDAILEDYASSSCQTGFYHEMHGTVVQAVAKNIGLANSSNVEIEHADKTFEFHVNAYWNENLLNKCDSIAHTYLEALWEAFRRRNPVTLQHALRRSAQSCYYNRGYFQISYENHILEAYTFVSDSVRRCWKLGFEKCNDICDKEDLGRNAIKKMKGHNYPFARDACVKACKRLAVEHVQPLCWHGIGSNLGVLAKDYLNVTSERMMQGSPHLFLFDKEKEGDHRLREEALYENYKSVIEGGLRECLLLCTSREEQSCTRAMWEHCVMGYIYMMGAQLLAGKDGRLLACDFLGADPYLFNLCLFTLGGFLPDQALKAPVVGTVGLLSSAGERHKNQTLPHLDGERRSMVVKCVLGSSEDCFCSFPRHLDVI